MAAETLYATSEVAGGGATGASNATGAPNGVFTTNTGNVSWTQQWNMDNAAGTQANGLHSITVRFRKEPGQTGTPVLNSISVYNGATQIYTNSVLANATSSTGQDISVSVDSAVFSGIDLSNIIVEIVTTAAGGSPNVRAALQVDAITWTGDFTTTSITPVSGTDTSSLAISETSSRLVLISSTDTSSLIINDQGTLGISGVETAAPTRVLFAAPTTGNFSSTTSPKTTPSFAVQAGDLITVIASIENGGATIGAPTTTGDVTWTSRGTAGSGSSQAVVYLWTGVVNSTSAGITISMTSSGGGLVWGFGATLWRNHGGVGNIAVNNGASANAQLAIVCSKNSAILGQADDWNAISGTNRVWLSINGSAIQESTYYSNTGVTHTVYGGYHTDVGAAGTKTWGLSTPSSGLKTAIGVIEVLGGAASGGTPISGTDAASLAISEASSIVKSSTASDTSSISVGESRQIFVTLSSSDTSSISVAETRTINSELTSSDTTSIAITEVASVSTTISTSDTSTLAITETTSGFALASSTDSLSLAVDDQGSFGTTSVPGVDTLSVGISESTQIAITLTATDTQALTASETVEMIKNLSKTSADSSSMSIAEETVNFNTIDRSDTSSINISSSVDTTLTLVTADNGSLAINETSQTFVSITATDSWSLAVGEGTGGSTTRAGSDSSTISITESVSISITDQVNDISSISIDESVSIRKNISSSDTSSVTITESIGALVSFSSSDTDTLATTETNTKFVSLTANDTTSVTIAETENEKFEVPSEDTSSISIFEESLVNAHEGRVAMVWHNGQWVTGTMMVFQNGDWRLASVKIYQSGIWV